MYCWLTVCGCQTPSSWCGFASMARHPVRMALDLVLVDRRWIHPLGHHPVVTVDRRWADL